MICTRLSDQSCWLAEASSLQVTLEFYNCCKILLLLYIHGLSFNRKLYSLGSVTQHDQ